MTMPISMENEYVDLMLKLQREYEIEDEEALCTALDELNELLHFPLRVQELQERSLAGQFSLVFRVFCDQANTFTEHLAEALLLYLTHRANSSAKVRLFYELRDMDGATHEEGTLIGFGG
jgi:hypothetical protein